MFSGSQSFSYFSRKNILIWLSMAFQGGAINAGGFIACHRFVTHTTGFATYFGTEFALGNIQSAFGMLTVPMFFLLGAATSGFLVDRRVTMGFKPAYHLSFGLISLFMLAAAWFGQRGVFGTFGDPLELSKDYSLLALLCLASGLQNGTITSASGSVIRTTHLTGITTDLGLGIIRVIASKHSTEVKTQEHRANWMRIGIIGFFVLGSAVSSFIYYHFN